MLCFCLLQVNVSMPQMVACFDGFYNPATSKDCVKGPKPNVTTEQQIVARSMVFQVLIPYTVQTIQSQMNCFISFALGNNVSTVCVSVYIISNRGIYIS